MGEKTVVTWVCDHCKLESEPLHGGITFNWNYDSPKGWCSFTEDARTFYDANRQKYTIRNNLQFWGVGNDPRLMPKEKHMFTFCCEEHKQEWLKAHRSEPSWEFVP